MSTKKDLKIGELKFSSRLTIGDIRRAKAEFDMDLANTENDSPVVRMMFDPLVLTDVVWALYGPRLQQKDVASAEKLDEKINPDDIEALRTGVAEAIGGFFPLVKILCTEIKGSLDGSSSLEELMEKANKMKAMAQQVSGTTS